MPGIVSIFFGASVAAVGGVVLPELDGLGDAVVLVDVACVPPPPPLHATATSPRIVASTTRRRGHLRSVLRSKRAE